MCLFSSRLLGKGKRWFGRLRKGNVEAVGGDEITLETVDGLKPAILRGVGKPEYLYLLMPVRVP